MSEKKDIQTVRKQLSTFVKMLHEKDYKEAEIVALFVVGSIGTRMAMNRGNADGRDAVKAIDEVIASLIKCKEDYQNHKKGFMDFF